MSFLDNRQYISALEKTGDVVRIKQEIDWELQAGAIVRRCNEIRGPATLFEKLKGYPAGYRIFGGPLTTERRLNIALGLPPETHLKATYEEYEKLVSHPLPPILVDKAPCKQNILSGRDVDLFHFPVPLIHDGDGGRFLGTWNIVVVRDPESNWTNWGMYRSMVQNRRATSLSLHMGNDGGRIYYTRFAPLKKPMPVALVIAADPLSSLCAAIRFPSGQSEVEFAGGLHRKPIELVKCETSELLAPAHAEIVVEGEYSPEYLVPEGPFGEFPGYRTGWDWKEVLRVKAITFRNDPLITLVNPGMPLSEGAIGPGMGRAVNLKKALRACGVPVVDVYLPPETATMVALVSLRKHGQNNMPTIAKHIVLSHDPFAQKVFVVDDDVDVFNLPEVFHAFATRLHPARGISIENKERAMGLAPFLTEEERRQGRGAAAFFDCTWPSEWSPQEDIPPRISFRDNYPSTLQEEILRDWKKYGFKW